MPRTQTFPSSHIETLYSIEKHREGLGTYKANMYIGDTELGQLHGHAYHICKCSREDGRHLQTLKRQRAATRHKPCILDPEVCSSPSACSREPHSKMPPPAHHRTNCNTIIQFKIITMHACRTGSCTWLTLLSWGIAQLYQVWSPPRQVYALCAVSVESNMYW